MMTRWMFTWVLLLFLIGGSDVTAQSVVVLTRGAAVQQAMAANESVLIAASQQVAARQRVREVRSDGLPSLDASVNYTRNWLLPTFVFAEQQVKIGSDNIITGNLTLRQPLYTGGRVRGSRRRAESEAQSTDYAGLRTQQQIAAQVEIAIYDLMLAAEIRAVHRLALSRARSNLQQVVALHRVGQATPFDLTRARVQVSTARADSVAGESQHAQAEMALKDLIGMPLSQGAELDTEYRTTTRLDLTDVAGLITLATEHRPESRQWTLLLEAQSGAVAIARAGGRPQLDLVANGQMQFQNDALGDASDSDEWRRSWSTGVVLSVPLFDGRRADAQSAQARQISRQLELEQARTGRTIEREVRQSWLSLKEAEGRLLAREGSVAQATKGLQDAESRYRTGRGRQLEVLDAHLALVEAETEFARARRDQAMALVQLELAVGVLKVAPDAADGQG